MTTYIRIDKREARRVYDSNGTIVMSLEQPTVHIGATVEWTGITTITKSGAGADTFDKLAEDGIMWKHRYPGSQGLVWYTPAPEPPTPLTPFDTGVRAEPKVWGEGHCESDEDYGKVDFNDDGDYTLATLHIERGEDGSYALRGYANEPLAVDITDQTDEGLMLIVQPTAELQIKVKDVIDDLDTETERIEAEVYWQHSSALVLVPGETGYRKQQAIMVYDNGLKPSSAIVKSWADGVRDTRIG